MVKKINPQNQYSPVFASISWDFNNEDENNRQEWFRQFSNFPAWLKLGMVDIEIDREIRRASIRIFGNEDPQKAGELSRIIRDIFLGKILKNRIPERLVKKLGLSEKDATRAKEEILRIIELIKKIGKEKELKIFDKLSIIMALKRYDNLGKQLISSEPLNLKTHQYPVAPNIKNWLEDYIQKMGAHSHTSIERSDYLFNSENGKRLDPQDRQRVSVILESYDKDTDLLIDKEEQRVVFDFSSEESSREKAEKRSQLLNFNEFKKIEPEAKTSPKEPEKLEKEDKEKEGGKEGKAKIQEEGHAGASFSSSKEKDILRNKKEGLALTEPKGESPENKDPKNQKQSTWEKDSFVSQNQKPLSHLSFQSKEKEKKSASPFPSESAFLEDAEKKAVVEGKNKSVFQGSNQEKKEEKQRNFSGAKQDQAPSLSKLLENLQKKAQKKDFSHNNKNFVSAGGSLENGEKPITKTEDNSFQAQNQKKAPNKEMSLAETLEKLQKKASPRDEKSDKDSFQKSSSEEKSQLVNLKEMTQPKQDLKPKNVLDLKGILSKKEKNDSDLT